MNGTLKIIKNYWFLIVAVVALISNMVLNQAQIATNAVEITELQDEYDVIREDLTIIKEDVSYIKGQLDEAR